MSSYRGTADRPDQAKAIAAVVAVHALLALMILTGLNVRMVRHAVEQLTTINIKEETPPPAAHRPQPSPKPSPKEAMKPAGAPAPKAEATPVAAPKQQLAPLPTIPVSRVAGVGQAPSAGAAATGNGNGAGGTGMGAGGGGSADYSRFTPARLVRNLGRADYRSIAGDRMPQGAAMVSLLVQPDGMPSDCRIVRSSGDSTVDTQLCPLVIARLRFRPALDDQQRPITYRIQYVATWSL